LTIIGYDATQLASDPLTVTLRAGQQSIANVSNISGVAVDLPLDATGQTVTLSAVNLSTANITTASGTTVVIRGTSYTIPAVPATVPATHNVLAMISLEANSGTVTNFASLVTVTLPYSGPTTNTPLVFWVVPGGSAWTQVTSAITVLTNGTLQFQINHFTVFMIAGVTTSVTSAVDTSNPTMAAVQILANGTTLVASGGQTEAQLITFTVDSITDNVGVVTSSIKFVIDSTTVTSGLITYTVNSNLTRKASYVSPTLSVGAHTVAFVASDAAGNTTTVSATFTIVSANIADGDVYNWPNPVRTASTKIHYNLGSAKTVKIYIYNAIGELVNHVELAGSIGSNDWTWNTTDAYGNTVANGIYFIHILSGDSLIGKAKALVIGK
jgi:hypothetical protein